MADVFRHHGIAAGRLDLAGAVHLAALDWLTKELDRRQSG